MALRKQFICKEVSHPTAPAPSDTFVQWSVTDPAIHTSNIKGDHIQQGTNETLPVAFFRLFLGRGGGGRGVFRGSLGLSWQSAPLKPGQHLHSNCVTVLYLVTNLGLKFTRYLQTERTGSHVSDGYRSVSSPPLLDLAMMWRVLHGFCFKWQYHLVWFRKPALGGA